MPTTTEPEQEWRFKLVGYDDRMDFASAWLLEGSIAELDQWFLECVPAEDGSNRWKEA